LIIESKHFGNVKIPEEEIITFPFGILGFEHIKSMCCWGKVGNDNPFMWLHAVEHPEVVCGHGSLYF